MDKKKLWTLFHTMFMISAFTLGGGYVMVSLIKKKYVDELNWMDEKVMLDITALATSSPGVIAVNTSILLGYRLAGVLGSFAALAATVLPPLITISVISVFYDAFRQNAIIAGLLYGMGAGVGSMLADVVYTMTRNIVKQRDRLDDCVMAAAFAAAFLFKVNIILIILCCAVIGLIRSGKASRAKGTP
jgi:chromate transporter